MFAYGCDSDSMAKQLKAFATRVGLEFDYEKDDHTHQTCFKFLDKSVSPYRGCMRFIPYYLFDDYRRFESIKKQIIHEVVDELLIPKGE